MLKNNISSDDIINKFVQEGSVKKRVEVIEDLSGDVKASNPKRKWSILTVLSVGVLALGVAAVAAAVHVFGAPITLPLAVGVGTFGALAAAGLEGIVIISIARANI